MLRRGNTYSLSFKLGNVEIDDVEKAEFTIGTIKKVYPTNVEYEDGKFIVELSQQDTFSLKTVIPVPIQARVKFTDGHVSATDIKRYKVDVSLSEDIL